jgi:hypothetical protein
MKKIHRNQSTKSKFQDEREEYKEVMGSLVQIEPGVVKDHPESPSEDDPEISTSSDSFLHGIYLQKIPYKIINTCVEEMEDLAFEPVPFAEAVKKFEDGQVYSLLNKDEEG